MKFRYGTDVHFNIVWIAIEISFPAYEKRPPEHQIGRSSTFLSGNFQAVLNICDVHFQADCIAYPRCARKFIGHIVFGKAGAREFEESGYHK